MNENYTQIALAGILARRAVFATESDDPEVWFRALESVCDSSAIESWRALGRYEPTEDAAVDCAIPIDQRKKRGVFFTPAPLAARVASALTTSSRLTEGAVVLDPACGDGSLLEAILEEAPTCRVVGVEIDPLLCVAAGLRLLACGADGFIHCGDGLDPRYWDVDAVISNPPYVGEKGNRALFQSVLADHPDLESVSRPRMDLFYFFLFRAAMAGVPSAFLTSDYWLTADGADVLRETLKTAGVRRLIRIGAGQFPDAPGHHSLISVFGSTDGETDVERLDGVIAGWTPEQGTWHPFATVEKRDGVALDTLSTNFQGVVSGADRVTKRLAELTTKPIGTPIFLREESLADDVGGLPWWPLLRAHHLTPNAVFLERRSDAFLLWVDRETDDRSDVARYLAPFRKILERRREVANHKMHWTSLHWPRSAANFRRPKLVVPRRAKSCCFALDIAGHVVSSDCTVINAPTDCPDPVRHLAHLMVALNSEETFEYLREYGKCKGDVLEFYASPLSGIPLDVERVDGVAQNRDPVRFDAAEAILRVAAPLDASNVAEVL